MLFSLSTVSSLYKDQIFICPERHPKWWSVDGVKLWFIRMKSKDALAQPRAQSGFILCSVRDSPVAASIRQRSLWEGRGFWMHPVFASVCVRDCNVTSAFVQRTDVRYSVSLCVCVKSYMKRGRTEPWIGEVFRITFSLMSARNKCIVGWIIVGVYTDHHHSYWNRFSWNVYESIVCGTITLTLRKVWNSWSLPRVWMMRINILSDTNIV